MGLEFSGLYLSLSLNNGIAFAFFKAIYSQIK